MVLKLSSLISTGLEFVDSKAKLLAGDLRLLGDLSQLNRRTRMAWQNRRTSRTLYLYLHHQRRRIVRRQEIRKLVEP